jgi:hypothetical protein
MVAAIAEIITCPVCGTKNHHLQVACSSCGGYIQRKIDNLDLFDTAWDVIESPQKAFHSIAVARYKNYAIFLSCVAGIGLAFTVFWLVKAGDYTDQLISILGAGLALGPVLGLATVLIGSGITRAMVAFSKLEATYRNLFAISAYSMLPVVISVFTILPIELMSYGLYMFTANPSPYLLHPFSFIMILILDGTCAVWTIALYFIGLKAVLGVRYGKVLLIGGISLAVLLGIFFLTFFFLKRL